MKSLFTLLILLDKASVDVRAEAHLLPETPVEANKGLHCCRRGKCVERRIFLRVGLGIAPELRVPSTEARAGGAQERVPSPLFHPVASSV